MLFFKSQNQDEITEIYQLNEVGILRKQEAIYTYWWDDVPNFGDWIGPYLLAKISNRPLMNMKGKNCDHVLFSVGSILEHIDKSYQHAEVWGSGLIQPLERKRAKKLTNNIGKVYAVRGEQTYHQLTEKVGLDIPKVLGDPALLMPQFYQPKLKTNSQDKISICPHFSHYDYFSKLNQSTKFDVIDVRNSVQHVIDQIVNSTLCISSSLHGLIIAQAYGVPWIRLDLNEYPLDGGDFKFEDFFSTLHNSQNIYRQTYSLSDINEAQLYKLSRHANLYKLKYETQRLLDVCPYRD